MRREWFASPPPTDLTIIYFAYFYKIDFDFVEKGIKSGEVLLYTNEEIKELEAAAEAEWLELAERIAAAEKRLEAEEAAERKEVEQAEKQIRISKKT